MTQEATQVQEVLIDNLRVFVVPVDILNVPNLTTYEKMAYIVIRSFCNPQGENAFPSYNTIAQKGSMSRSTAIRAVNSLLEKGLLQKEIRLDISKNRKIRNTSNLYKLEHPAKALETGVVSHRHHPSVTQTPRVVSHRHHPSVTQTPKQNQLTKSLRKKSSKSVSKQTPTTVVEPTVELCQLPRLTDRLTEYNFGMELKGQLVAFAVGLGLTDEQAVNTIEMTVESAQKGKLHYWPYVSTVFKEKAEIAKAGNVIRAGQKKAVIEDQLPMAVKRQLEREAEEERMRATGVEIEKPTTKKVTDDPELAELLNALREQAPKTGNPRVVQVGQAAEEDKKPF